MTHKLNLGSGYAKLADYCNVDIDPKTNPDICIDLEKQIWPFADNSVSHVMVHHILEHCGDPGYFHFIKELYRVCQDGALISVIVPHHRHDVFLNDPTHRRPITVEGLRLFGKKFNQLCIDTGDGSSKLGFYFDVDFEIVKFQYIFDPHYTELLDEVTEETQQKIQTMLRQFNNMIIETHVMLMAIK